MGHSSSKGKEASQGYMMDSLSAEAQGKKTKYNRENINFDFLS